MAGRPIVVDTRKALAILAIVAAESRPFARDELAAMFWPEADDEAARGALRRTLSALRSAVGSAGLTIDRARVAIDPSAADVDLADLERLAGSERTTDLEAAAALARGPFLAGFALRDSPAFDDWQAARAVRADRLVADVFDRLAGARQASGDLTGATDAARRRVALDPLDELGQRRLIELLARSGDRAGAIRQYRSLVALLERELGVAPLRETSELYEAIREERVGPSLAAARPIAEVMPALPLVGRDDELAQLISAAGRAAPDGVVVVLEGEAGIGKTRLAESLVANVRARGGVVLSSRAYPGETGIAYGPIVESLRIGLASRDAADRLATLDPAALGEMGRLVELPPGMPGSSVVSGGGSEARVRLLDAIAAGLTVLAAGPVPGLIWIDDLHLADDSTREAIAYVARRLSGRPVILLLAWRHEDLSRAGVTWAEELARMRGVSTIVLGRLGREGVAAMMSAARPDATLSAAEIEAVVAGSEGLPLHVVEALSADDPVAGSVSRGVHALLRARISSVGETAGQVLAAAAVIGRSFDLPTVRHASGRSEEETIEAMEELVRRGLVRDDDDIADGPIRYDFSHGRLREAAYEAISPARRRLLHRRTADALRLDLPGVGGDAVARFVLIASHERAAGRPAEAIVAFREAAVRAEAVFANREAIDHLEAALGLGDADRSAIHARIGGLHARMGEYPAAIASLETAAALAGPVELSGLEIALGRVHRRRGDLAAAADHLDVALSSPDLGQDDRFLGLVERSGVALRAGESNLAAETADEARALAERSGDPRAAGVAERLIGLVAYARGDLRPAIAALERSVMLAAHDPDPTAEVAARTGLALACAAAGSTPAAIDQASRALDVCRRIGDRHLEAAVENHLADILHDAGDDAGAMDHLKRAVALFAEVGGDPAAPDPGIWMLAAW